MPVLSMFYGIIVSMYFEKDGKHSEPHFHAKYGEYKAEVDFNGQIIAGEVACKTGGIRQSMGVYPSRGAARKLGTCRAKREALPHRALEVR